jgi:hypothetical protein
METLKNRKYTDLSNGRVVQVTDHFEDIVILDGKSKVKLSTLLNDKLYDEYIDPMNFFRNESLVNAFTEKIRQLPNEQIRESAFDQPKLLNNYGNPLDRIDDEPAVLPYDPEEEKQQLIAKAKKMFGSPQNAVERQMESFKDLLVEEEEQTTVEEKNDTNLFDKTPVNNFMNQPPTNTQSLDPIIQMFRNVKRNTEFNIKFEINNKIPRLDFIEMMEDSYNTSIIDFLAEEFTNQILLNPQVIKNKIKDQINLMLHKKANTQSETKPTTPSTNSRKKILPKND